jgi:hypothetical protein
MIMNFKNKTFVTPAGLALEQLGTFVEYIQRVGFRFVITREGRFYPIAVTHRHSGVLVCNISKLELAACPGDLVGTGKLSLKHLVESKGVDRVIAALQRAENSSTPQNPSMRL